MLNPGLPEALWSRLDGRLWHATERNSLSKILSDGEIRPAVGDRYRNSFCRCRGSVSLFDFGPTAVDIRGQFNNWAGWFGHQQESRIAIWLEIDRARSIECLLDAGAARQKSHERPCKQIIPGVEACHKGPIPLAAVVGVLLIARDNLELFQQCDEFPGEIFQHIAAFDRDLPPPPQDSLVETLQAGRRRCAEREEPARKVGSSNDPGEK